MEWVVGVASFVVGSVIGALIIWARAASHRQRADSLGQQLSLRSAECDQVRRDADQRSVRVAQLEEQLRTQQVQFEEQKRILEEAEKKLVTVFEATGAKLLENNANRFMKQAEKSFEDKAKPIRELLKTQKQAVDELEKKRETAYVRVEEQIKHIVQAHERLGTETDRLVTALRRPEQRGRWGEIQLRNVVELAGMTEHCDFHEQIPTDDPSTRDRPDMVVRLPGDGVIVVDSKVSLDAYLNSIQSDADRAGELQRHARQVESHVRRLSSKEYWKQFVRTPPVVVMFMPLESALHAALEVQPNLHVDAMKQHVHIATPTLLVALLRTIAYGWQQEAIAENARQIADVGRDLYDRLSTFAGHFAKVGKGLESANSGYNSAIGSLERMVLPGARRLKDLRATAAGDFEGPEQIDSDVRKMTAPELTERMDEQENSSKICD